jgi:hypothetical protein
VAAALAHRGYREARPCSADCPIPAAGRLAGWLAGWLARASGARRGPGRGHLPGHPSRGAAAGRRPSG